MIELHGLGDFLLLYALVLALGALGGLVFELGKGGRGQLERPRKLQGSRDIGWWANVIIGAAAAAAALWVFPPEQTITVVNGVTTSTLRYNVVAVIGLSIIVGSAGGAFLTAFQARALALVKAQEATTTKQIATDAVNELVQGIQGGFPTEQLLGVANTATRAIRNVGDSGIGNPDPANI